MFDVKINQDVNLCDYNKYRHYVGTIDSLLYGNFKSKKHKSSMVEERHVHHKKIIRVMSINHKKF